MHTCIKILSMLFLQRKFFAIKKIQKAKKKKKKKKKIGRAHDRTPYTYKTLIPDYSLKKKNNTKKKNTL